MDSRAGAAALRRLGAGMAILMASAWVAGCTQEDERARTLRHSFSPKLEEAGSLRYIEKAYPADGGSVVFHFQTEKRVSVIIWAKHWRQEMGGNSKYQEIRISDSWSNDGFELQRGSLLEEKLHELLRTARIGDGSGGTDAGARPTRESLNWLLARVKDRSLKWNQPD